MACQFAALMLLPTPVPGPIFPPPAALWGKPPAAAPAFGAPKARGVHAATAGRKPAAGAAGRTHPAAIGACASALGPRPAAGGTAPAAQRNPGLAEDPVHEAVRPARRGGQSPDTLPRV